MKVQADNFLRVPLVTVFGRAVCRKTLRTVRRGGANGLPEETGQPGYFGTKKPYKKPYFYIDTFSSPIYYNLMSKRSDFEWDS